MGRRGTPTTLRLLDPVASLLRVRIEAESTRRQETLKAAGAVIGPGGLWRGRQGLQPAAGQERAVSDISVVVRVVDRLWRGSGAVPPAGSIGRSEGLMSAECHSTMRASRRAYIRRGLKPSASRYPIAAPAALHRRRAWPGDFPQPCLPPV